MQIQNSAPQNKSNDDDLLDVLFNNSGNGKKAEESKERSISNDRSSNKAGSNRSFGSKIYVHKINDNGNGSLQSSVNLTSVQLSSYISLNYSGSDSAENHDTWSVQRKSTFNKTNTLNPEVVPFTLEDEKFLQSGYTLELSEDDEEDHFIEQEPSLSIDEMNASNGTHKKFKQQNFNENQRHLKEYTNAKITTDKILVHQTYMDDIKNANYNEQIHINIDKIPTKQSSNFSDNHMRLQYADRNWDTEESKERPINTDVMELDNSAEFHLDNSPEAHLNINIPTEPNDEMQKSLFDRQSKWLLRTLQPKLMFKANFCARNLQKRSYFSKPSD